MSTCMHNKTFKDSKYRYFSLGGTEHYSADSWDQYQLSFWPKKLYQLSTVYMNRTDYNVVNVVVHRQRENGLHYKHFGFFFQIQHIKYMLS